MQDERVVALQVREPVLDAVLVWQAEVRDGGAEVSGSGSWDAPSDSVNDRERGDVERAAVVGPGEVVRGLGQAAAADVLPISPLGRMKIAAVRALSTATREDAICASGVRRRARSSSERVDDGQRDLVRRLNTQGA
jgi:hypothetical protein